MHVCKLQKVLRVPVQSFTIGMQMPTLNSPCKRRGALHAIVEGEMTVITQNPPADIAATSQNLSGVIPAMPGSVGIAGLRALTPSQRSQLESVRVILQDGDGRGSYDRRGNAGGVKYHLETQLLTFVLYCNLSKVDSSQPTLPSSCSRSK